MYNIHQQSLKNLRLFQMISNAAERTYLLQGFEPNGVCENNIILNNIIHAYLIDY